MPTETTYTNARANLAALLDRVAADRDTVIIRRRGGEDVALISAAELSSLEETAHLLRSSRNAERLMAALERARRAEGTPETVSTLRRDLGLDARG